MKSDKLLDAMEFISEDKVLDAKYGKIKRHVNWKKMVSAAACVLCVVVGSVKALNYFGNYNVTDGQNEGMVEGAAGEVSCDDLPGDTTPTIVYNNKLYYWSGLEVVPNSFERVANAEAAPDKPQTAEIQIEAEFDAEGEVYANPEYPEVIYVEMSTDWFANKTVRFVTKELGDCERIAYQGRQYRMKYGTGEDQIETLPEESELIGTLHFIGRDSVPQNDLETNIPNDVHSMDSMEGREVFACPADKSKIYVTIYDYYRGGMEIMYQACYLWED